MAAALLFGTALAVPSTPWVAVVANCLAVAAQARASTAPGWAWVVKILGPTDDLRTGTWLHGVAAAGG